MMEQVDAGISAVKKIRKMYRDIPIYLLSDIGQATSMNIDISELGVNGALQKPISEKDIIKITKDSLKEK